ncbi:MAG: hypothetical protein HWN80_13095 [Candidatus Lokiarchaeota archaeon]|nr:hypothetical protein [Candidatus Lokiarchaeota archaeon]
MTGQVPDTLIYRNNEYSIVGLKGEDLPSPFDYDLRPVSPHTANWRGFVMNFIIVEKCLELDEMNVTVEDTKKKHPIINDVKPKAKKEGLINLKYENLKLKTQFSGKMLIAKDFIDSMYVHMGFQSPISFDTVIELEFSDGNLLSVKDMSEKMKKYRRKNISDGKLKPTHDPQAWIARTFSLDYDF